MIGDEGLAFCRGIALALNWADHRCECGAGRWAAFGPEWVQCQLCELCIPVAELADQVIEGRVPVRNLTSVKLPIAPRRPQ